MGCITVPALYGYWVNCKYNLKSYKLRSSPNMSQGTTGSYFSNLPAEIILKILVNLNTKDLLNFCEIYECEWVLRERYVVHTTNISKEYRLNNLNLLIKKIDCDLISTLNLNGLYWIKAKELKQLIRKCKNVINLFLIDTKLNVANPDFIEAVNLSGKVQKLALTWKDFDQDGHVPTFNTVTTLYVVNSYSLTRFLKLFPNLSKLWIDFGCGLFCSPPVSFKLDLFKVFTSSQSGCSIGWEIYGLSKYFESRRPSQPSIFCWEKFPEGKKMGNLIVSDNLTNEHWATLQDLHAPMPYSPKVAKRLLNKDRSLNEIAFEDLNFHNNTINCIERQVRASLEILKTSNTSLLKRLAIDACILQGDTNDGKICTETNKKKRVGIDHSPDNHRTVERLFKKIPNLEVLEVFNCRQPHVSSIPGYFLLASFEKLCSFTVEVPIILDGKFLIDVCKECRFLEILRVTSRTQHELLNYHISQALTFAKLLKDFRFENHTIPCDKLLGVLSSSKRIERVLLSCTAVSSLSSNVLKKFFEYCSHLVFFGLLVDEMTDSFKKSVSTLMRLYVKNHPSRVFVILKKGGFSNLDHHPIPDLHYKEMVNVDSRVAGIDPYKEFIDF